MKRTCLLVLSLFVATAAVADEPAYETRVIGAGTFTFTQPRALRAGPDGSVYMIEGDTDWATMRRMSADLASSQRFSAKVVTPDATLRSSEDASSLRSTSNAPGKWFHPAGFHVTKTGDLLVADTGQKRILRLGPNGEFKSLAVRPGAPANLSGPTDALELPSGEIVVCDSASSRILLFAADGTLRRAVAGPGTGSDEVDHPFSLALDREGDLWTVDTLNRRLVERGRGLAVTRVVRPGAPDGPLLHSPSYLDVDARGNLLVADDGRSCVFKLSPAGEVLARLGMGENERRPFSRVSGVAALGDGTTLVSDSGRGVLVRFAADGRILGEIGFSHFRMQGGGPASAAVDRSGGFYLVGSRVPCNVRYCGPDGLMRAEFGGEGTEPGKLLRPRAAAAGPDGFLYVADSERHDVTVFRNTGALVRVFGRAGSGPADLRYPRAIAVGPDGLVFVGDAGNRRVQVFNPAGEFVRTFVRDVNPYSLDVDPEGRIAVFDDADEFIATYDRAGRELSRVDVSEVTSFGGMALAADGTVRVLERRGGIVKSFAPGGTPGGDEVLRDPRLAWGATLSRAADGRAVIASPGGVFRVDDGRLGAFVEVRLPVEGGKLLRPGSLALVWKDELAVLSDPAGVIQVFGRDGTFRRVLSTTPAIRGISRISAAPGGDLFVLSSLDGVLYRAGKDGRAQPAVAWDALRGAGGVAMLGDGRAWVNQDPRSGLALIGADGKELGRLPGGDRRYRHWGRNFSVTALGDVITAGQGDGRIACYGTDLARRWEIDAEKLDEPVRLRSIAATFTSGEGRLYVLGGDGSGIRVFGADRAFLAAIRPDAAIGSFSGASDIAVDADGTLYVADTANNRVVKLVKRATSDR